jgi:hypothetical protein
MAYQHYFNKQEKKFSQKKAKEKDKEKLRDLRRINERLEKAWAASVRASGALP